MRSLRILQNGATYHVTSNIDHNDMSLLEPQFKMLFLDFVGKAKRKFHFRLWDFCIMGNHIHFLIQPGREGNLSEIMQWIKCNFAKAWNKAHNRTGHVWGERFYSRIIRGVGEFLRVRGYVAENPVRAGLVEEAGEWVYGSVYQRLHGQSDLLDEPPGMV